MSGTGERACLMSSSSRCTCSWWPRRAALKALALPVSPHSELGWPGDHEEIRGLRRRFATTVTTQDYRAIGANCIGVLEALGAVV
jgi:hypothetical protein